MLGLNLNDPHRRVSPAKKEPDAEILVVADAIVRLRKFVPNCNRKAELSALLTNHLSTGRDFMTAPDWSPDWERKKIKIELSAFDMLVAAYPDETKRQQFVDSIVLWEVERFEHFA